MNNFLQQYGLMIVAVIITLIFIVFASVFGGTITDGIKDITADFFAKSGVTADVDGDDETNNLGSDTITWNGMVGNRTISEDTRDNLMMVHISDATPTIDDLSNGGSVVMDENGVPTTYTFTSGIDKGDIIFVSEFVAVVKKANITWGDNTYTKTGTYFFAAPNVDSPQVYCSSFTINGYIGF